MPENSHTADFDFSVTEVLLVHRNSHVHNFKWTEYRTGRKMDGLVFCIGGRALYDCNGETFSIGEGQVLFLPATSSYTMRAESIEPFLHYTVNFRLSPPECDPSSGIAEILTGKRRYLTDPHKAPMFSEHFERLLSVWQSKGSGYRVMAKSLILELLYLYLTDARRTLRDSGDYKKLLPAKKRLDDCLDNTGIAELAALCSLSETHFRRLFYQLFGSSPTEYRLRKRLLRACDLLLSEQYSVTDAARETGFSDPNYFTRIFRRHIGVTPTEYMKGESP